MLPDPAGTSAAVPFDGVPIADMESVLDDVA